MSELKVIVSAIVVLFPVNRIKTCRNFLPVKLATDIVADVPLRVVVHSVERKSVGAAVISMPLMLFIIPVVVEVVLRTGLLICPTVVGSVEVKRPAVLGERKYVVSLVRVPRVANPSIVKVKLFTSATAVTTQTTSALVAESACALE